MRLGSGLLFKEFDMDLIGKIFGRSVVLTSHRTESPSIETFVFEAGRQLPWKAGQYYVYLIPQAWRDKRSPFRPYSVSNAPGGTTLELTTRFPETPSLFKQSLRAMAPGTRVRAFGPYGSFAPSRSATEHVFIAGGIGITPFMSMIRDFAGRGDMPPVTLLYASRDGQVPFREELDEVASRFPSLKVHYVIDPQRVDAETVQRLVPNVAGSTFYVSGPPPMVKGVAGTLKGIGVRGSRIKRDNFRGYPC